MRSATIPVFLLLLGAPLHGQSNLPFEVRTVGEFGVAAVDGPTAHRFELGPNVLLPGGDTRLDTRSFQNPLEFLFSSHWAGAVITPQRNPDGDPGLRWLENGNASATQPGFVGSTNASAGVPAQESHTLRFAVAAPAGSTGELYVDWAVFTGGAASVAFDVDGDGTVERTATAPGAYGGGSLQTTIPVTVGAGGLVVDITVDVELRTPGSGSYFSSLQVYYRPDRAAALCSVTPDPSVCDLALAGAIGLDATGATAVGLQLSGIEPQSFGLLFVGTPAAAPMMPAGAACPVTVQPQTSMFWFGYEPSIDWSFPVGRAPQFDFRVQAATYRYVTGVGPVVQVSNELALLCQ